MNNCQQQQQQKIYIIFLTNSNLKTIKITIQIFNFVDVIHSRNRICVYFKSMLQITNTNVATTRINNDEKKCVDFDCRFLSQLSFMFNFE